MLWENRLEGGERRAVAEAGRADVEAFAVVSSAGNEDGGSDLGGSWGVTRK